MIRQTPDEHRLTIEEVNDPVTIARCRDQDERASRNSAWLQTHWTMILPKARGKFVAVANQEAFIGDTAQEAWERARTAHPEDDGIISQYVFPDRGSRIYAYRR
jgi:hypothetical protein